MSQLKTLSHKKPLPPPPPASNSQIINDDLCLSFCLLILIGEPLSQQKRWGKTDENGCPDLHELSFKAHIQKFIITGVNFSQMCGHQMCIAFNPTSPNPHRHVSICLVSGHMGHHLYKRQGSWVWDSVLCLNLAQGPQIESILIYTLKKNLIVLITTKPIFWGRRSRHLHRSFT